MVCGKHVHRTRQKAKAHLIHNKGRSKNAAVYFCPLCDGYHVGRAKPWQESNQKKRVTSRLLTLEDE